MREPVRQTRTKCKATSGASWKNLVTSKTSQQCGVNVVFKRKCLQICDWSRFKLRSLWCSEVSSQSAHPRTDLWSQTIFGGNGMLVPLLGSIKELYIKPYTLSFLFSSNELLMQLDKEISFEPSGD